MTSAIKFPTYVVGLMSGTSADGVDAAILRTDGRTQAEPIASAHIPYEDGLRRAILTLMKGAGDMDAIARALTEVHLQAVEAVISISGLERSAVQLIGFHGQTIIHKPDQGYTLQIGDAGWLATQTGIPVVFDFRSNDIKHGGQGAPLVPVYHAALAIDLPKPLMVVNIGGVANYTWLGENDAIEAADCGPGNALIDDWMGKHYGARCDMNGVAAKRGIANESVVKQFLRDKFFVANKSRSLDRNHFTIDAVRGMSVEDGAATLTAITAAAITWSTRAMPEAPKQLLITGGGRHNPVLMRMIQERACDQALTEVCEVLPVEAVGWNGDMLEAEAFAYLAARSVQGLPLSFPSTTGVSEPVTGGVLFMPEEIYHHHHDDDEDSTTPRSCCR